MQAPRYRQVQTVAVAASAVTIVLTGIAFWLSYEHLAEVASANGLPDERGWVWPAAVDLFIVLGELLVLRASLQGRRDWWAISLAASGSLASIGLNVAGVGEDASRMEYIVAAVPPVAALLAFGALMRQVHEALRQTVVLQAPPAPPLPLQPPVEELEEPVEEAGGLPEWVEEALVTPTIDQGTLVEKLVANGEPLPGRKTVADTYGVSDWIARQALAEAKKRLQETSQLATTAKEN